MLFSFLPRIVAANFKYVFFNPVGADAVEQHVSLHLVWCVISWLRNCCKNPVSVMATIVKSRKRFHVFLPHPSYDGARLKK